jgi:copper homeostasis protein
VGGLTPSVGLLQQSKELCPKLPVYAMIRPRSGDFNYSQNEILIMRKDIEILKSYGADGFVFGILRTDGTVDTNNCEVLLGMN